MILLKIENEIGIALAAIAAIVLELWVMSLMERANIRKDPGGERKPNIVALE